jgi:acyl-CoA synthetase (AMP-forming)/AMP-acid ligase II
MYDMLVYGQRFRRTRQIIMRAGSNISPQEVEEALYRHRDVLEASVVGAPDPVYGSTNAGLLRDGTVSVMHCRRPATSPRMYRTGMRWPLT